jgi:hypothetical protein
MIKEAIKAIGGMARSKYSRMKADSAFSSKMMRTIGGEGIVGWKNYNYYGRKIGEMVKAGKHEEAKKYARQEHFRVVNDE